MAAAHKDLRGPLAQAWAKRRGGAKQPVDPESPSSQGSTPAPESPRPEPPLVDIAQAVDGELCKNLFSEDAVTKIAAVRAVFKHFDVDGNGVLDTKELHAALGASGVHISKKVVEDILTEIDMDDDGLVDEDEFVEFFRKMKQISNLEAMVEYNEVKSKYRSIILGVYIVINGLGVFVLVLLNDNNKGDPILSTFLTASIVMFVTALAVQLFLPLIMLKLKPVERWKAAKEWWKEFRFSRKPAAVAPEPEAEVQAVAATLSHLPQGGASTYRGRAGSKDPYGTAWPASRSGSKDPHGTTWPASRSGSKDPHEATWPPLPPQPPPPMGRPPPQPDTQAMAAMASLLNWEEKKGPEPLYFAGQYREAQEVSSSTQSTSCVVVANSGNHSVAIAPWGARYHDRTRLALEQNAGRLGGRHDRGVGSRRR